MMKNKPEVLSVPPDELQRIFGTNLVPQFTSDGACTNCNDRPLVHKVTLSRGHLSCLNKLSQSIIRKGRNQAHLIKDFIGELELTKYEYVAFQQLRYFGLARQVEDKPGHWFLTHLGAEFVHGRLPAREWVKVLRNQLLEQSLGRSPKKVFYNQIKGYPRWELPEFEIVAGDALVVPKKNPQSSLFNLKGQTA